MSQKIRRLVKVSYGLLSIVVIIWFIVLVSDSFNLYRWWLSYDIHNKYFIIVSIVWFIVWWIIFSDLIRRIASYINNWSIKWFINYKTYIWYILGILVFSWLIIRLWYQEEDKCKQLLQSWESWICTCLIWYKMDWDTCKREYKIYSTGDISLEYPSEMTLWNDYNNNIYIKKHTKESLIESMNWSKNYTDQESKDQRDKEKIEMEDSLNASIIWSNIFKPLWSQMITWYFINIWWYKWQIIISHHHDDLIPISKVDYIVYIYKDDIIYTINIDNEFWAVKRTYPDQYLSENENDEQVILDNIKNLYLYNSTPTFWNMYVLVENDRIIQDIIQSIKIIQKSPKVWWNIWWRIFK